MSAGGPAEPLRAQAAYDYLSDRNDPISRVVREHTARLISRCPHTVWYSRIR